MLPSVRRPASSLPRWAELGFDIDRFFNNAWNRPISTWAAWMPSADLYETDENFVVALELPGYRHEDLNVSVERGLLTVSGQRTVSEDEEGYTYHLRERGEGRFTRTFSLPIAVNSGEVTAEFRNGVLEITLPKMAEARPRRIEVSVK